MFSFFKKTSPLEKLQKEYEKLMADAHKLSHTDRKASDKKIAEAEEVIKKIEAL